MALTGSVACAEGLFRKDFKIDLKKGVHRNLIGLMENYFQDIGQGIADVANAIDAKDKEMTTNDNLEKKIDRGIVFSS